MTLQRSNHNFTYNIKFRMNHVFKYEVIVISDKIYKLLSTHDFYIDQPHSEIISITEYYKRYCDPIPSYSIGKMTIYGSKQLIAKIKLIL